MESKIISQIIFDTQDEKCKSISVDVHDYDELKKNFANPDGLQMDFILSEYLSDVVDNMQEFLKCNSDKFQNETDKQMDKYFILFYKMTNMLNVFKDIVYWSVVNAGMSNEVDAMADLILSDLNDDRE